MKPSIVTYGCDHLQKRNRLKGIALQKIILRTFDNKCEDISIKKILKIHDEEVKKYYYVSKPFFISGHGVVDKKFTYKNDIIDKTEFDGYTEIFVMKKKKGTYRLKKIFSGKYVADYLICYGLIVTMMKRFRKRVDFYKFIDGVFYIYEAKNKEISGLSFSDICSTMMYPLTLRKLGYKVKEIVIIFNGNFGTDTLNAVKRFQSRYNIKIILKPITLYLRQNNDNISRVDIRKIGDKYEYNITEGNEEEVKLFIS